MAAPPTSSSDVLPAVAITVVEQCRVSAAHDGPFGEVSIPLTFFDVPWLDNHPVRRLFFYRRPGITTAHFAASVVPRLRRSLSLALRHYYPLAGRLQPLPGSSKRFHIVCTDADSVTFTLAEYCDVVDKEGAGGEYYFAHLAGNHPRRVELLRPLVPGMTSASALLALQVTVFPGAGVCVGVSIGHAACDGSGFTSFVKAWASACRSTEEGAGGSRSPGELPVIDRTLVSDPAGELYAALVDSLKYLPGLSWTSAVDGVPAVERGTFLLRRAHIEELRRRVSEQVAPRFGVYGTDFGWGRPAKVEVVGIEESGAMALAESGEEDGGIEVGLALPAPEMARFSSLFTAGLEEDAGDGRGRAG